MGAAKRWTFSKRSSADFFAGRPKVSARSSRIITVMTSDSLQSLEREVSQFREQPCAGLIDRGGEAGAPSVLIVDDDPNIAPLVIRALKPYRMNTEVVTGGAEALVRLRERPYSLLVLDLEMTDVHGLDVLRTLRDVPRFQRLPVMILTAHANSQTLTRSFGIGADEFMKKPFDLHEFGVRAFRLIRPAAV
jgi:CheY-like chemotaxis protein